jgi:hypothetical protein
MARINGMKAAGGTRGTRGTTLRAMQAAICNVPVCRDL